VAVNRMVRISWDVKGGVCISRDFRVEQASVWGRGRVILGSVDRVVIL
jgi:hypothetical protein